MSNTISHGFPSTFSKVTKEKEGYISVDNTASHQSEPFNLVGESVGTVLLPAIEGYRYIIKGITILVDGNVGEILAKLTHEEVIETFLPIWVAQNNKGGTSSALNLICDPNTAVIVDAISIGGSTKYFVGLSYVVEKV